MPVDYLVTDTELSDIADAIRAKGGTSAQLSFPNGYTTAIAAIPTGINPSGTINITSAGTTDVTNYAIASVAAGTEGTPTATKGAVNNHAIAVTPSVTNSAGYITGGTKTGTAVSVAASEVVSGTYTVTGSGTKDVTNYASASIASGSASTPATTVTANPTISVSNGGLITASVSTTKSVTPSVSAGWVASGTAGTITVSGSNTSQLTAQAAQTITPTTSDQTIASGKYLTGTQTIKGDANLVAANIADGVTIFGVTGTHQGGGGGWEDITSSVTVSGVSITRYEFHYLTNGNGTYVGWFQFKANASGDLTISNGIDDPFNAIFWNYTDDTFSVESNGRKKFVLPVTSGKRYVLSFCVSI